MKSSAHKIAILVFFYCLPQPAFAFKLFPEGEKPSAIVLLGVMFAALLLALTVHELGHLLTGLAQGFRFQLFVVGPLGIKRAEDRIKVYFNTNVGMMGGVAATVPTAPDPSNRKKFARLILAGPLASLILGIVCLMLAPHAGSTMTWFLFIAGGSSVGFFAATTLPKKSGIYFTDRARFQRLMNKGKAGDSEEALLSIIAQSMMDNSHRRISLEQTRILQQDDDPFMRFWGFYYEYMYFRENEDPVYADNARATLIRHKGLVPGQIWSMLKIDDHPSAPAASEKR